MSTTAIATNGRPERLYKLRELERAGYGARQTLHRYVRTGALPAVMVGNAWMVRERDLPAFAEAVGVDSSATDVDVVDLGDIACMASKVVTSWPRLSTARKAQLAALLTAA